MTDTFPAKFAEVFTNHEPGKPAHEVLVVDRRTRFPDGVIKGTATVRYREYQGSLGAHCDGWLTGRGSTDSPEGIFAFICLDSLPDRELIRSTLMQMGKIEECEWARKMVQALDQLDGRDEE